MSVDLSQHHGIISNLFSLPTTAEEWELYRLSAEQVEFFREYGYLAGIKLLDAGQVEVLRAELSELVNPAHPLNHLFYEYHSNESADPSRVLFHALG
ncbi:MAG: phytanoyl-CoA dioxygenase family protein, partial [Deltaproteobacteria bacterium]|nr:phytanoyl-CoA dioxygenase family protein [Deltaproteobacteria bacterium]